MKTAIKAVMGKVARLPPIMSIIRRKLVKSTNIIYYHYFGARQCFSDDYEDCSIERFDADLRLIKKYFEFVSLFSVLEGHLSAREPERPQIALTFDDGFDMFRNGAADVLDSHGIKATAFLVTACIDNKDLIWVNKVTAIKTLRPGCCPLQYDVLMRKAGLPIAGDHDLTRAAMRTWPMAMKEELANELWKSCDMPPLNEFLDQYRPYLSWKGVEEWLKRGHWIGLHTHTHPKCEGIDEKMAEYEIETPARLLKERFHVPYLALAYPFGSRLKPELERKLYEKGAFDFALGIRGFSPQGTKPYRMDRLDAEDELEFGLFGKPLLS
jgi:peptidoglycan/xylan/chitin deacetylase (PgdA/CDA1 family)